MLEQYRAENARLAAEIHRIAGATTLEGYARKLAGPEGPNAWLDYEKAVNCFAPDPCLEGFIRGDVTLDSSHATLVASLDAALSRTHDFFESAKRSSWCFCPLDYGAGFDLSAPHLIKVSELSNHLLLSCQWHMAYGDKKLARRHLLYDVDLVQRGLPEPLLLSRLAQLSLASGLCEHLMEWGPQYDPDVRRTIAEALKGTHLRELMREGLIGEALQVESELLKVVQELSKAEDYSGPYGFILQHHVPAWREWDKMQIYEAYLAFIESPDLPSNPRPRPSKLAVMASTLVPEVGWMGATVAEWERMFAETVRKLGE